MLKLRRMRAYARDDGRRDRDGVYAKSAENMTKCLRQG